MIPLLHIITFLDFLFALFITANIFNSYQKSKNKNLRNFLAVFLTIGIYFGLVSLPGFIFDPVIVQIIYIVSYIPLYLSSFFMIWVLFNIAKFKIAYFIIPILILSAIIVPSLNIIFFSPASLRHFGNLFYYWTEGTPFWLQTIHGLLVGSAGLVTSILFFVGGMKSREKIVRYRAFLIGSGLIIFLIAAFFNFVLAIYIKDVLYRSIITIVGGLLSLSALSLIFLGVRYKPKPKGPKKNAEKNE